MDFLLKLLNNARDQNPQMCHVTNSTDEETRKNLRLASCQDRTASAMLKREQTSRPTSQSAKERAFKVIQ